jgi:hypothetical protein
LNMPTLRPTIQPIAAWMKNPSQSRLSGLAMEALCRFGRRAGAGLAASGGWVWADVCVPFAWIVRRRVCDLCGVFPAVSYRKVGVALFASLVLTSASQVLSPAALQQEGDSPMGASSPAPTALERAAAYAWLTGKQRKQYAPLSDRIDCPEGFTRVEAAPGSFAAWLRRLPIAPCGTPVTTSRSKIVAAGDAPNLAAVVELQPHTARLLSSTNMMLRLRAEYAWSAGELDTLGFHFACGHLSRWKDWTQGIRPLADGRSVRFAETGVKGDGRSNFCVYLETLFRFASGESLLDDTTGVQDATVAAGDIFLRTGRGDHAVMVLDIATNSHGEIRVLLGQGGRPAQTFHVLRDAGGSAWFAIGPSKLIGLGQCGTFAMDQLRRWVQ